MYDRQLLLHRAKRNAVLDLAEVQRYGLDSYGDADYVTIYGLRPADWHAKGIRVLGRTAVECTRDELADAIGQDVALTLATAPRPAAAFVIDPFAGSGNTLYWLLRHLPGARGLGLELDANVFQLTKQNLAVLALPIDIRQGPYTSEMAGVTVAPDHMLVAFLAPPWGEALSKTSGLDLRRTTPPLTEIVDFLLDRFHDNRMLCAVQIYETVVSSSLMELRSRFDWSALRIYGLNAPGENHGILLGTKGWVGRQSQ
jgi:hypothetical protein